MKFNCGIIGLPNIGKSTLFNALTHTYLAEVANHPFCTIEPNIGKTLIKDQRLKQIAKLAGSKKIIYNKLEIIDVAGLIKGANKGEGLGNKFLSHIREVDAIIHLIRCFEDDNIKHVHNKVDPILDIETVEMELILADINSIEKRLPRLEKKIKQGDKKFKRQFDLMHEVLSTLKDGNPVRKLKYINDNEIKLLQLLTTKPVIYVCNVKDMDVLIGNKLSKKVEKMAKKNKNKSFCISAKLEEDIANLKNEEEKQNFMLEFGLQESGLDKIIRTMYETLNMITFFTVGQEEASAWPIKAGSTASKAASIIHTDFEKGFIKAEKISLTDYLQYGSELACRNAGKIRFEGKNYVVQDGDIMHFKFRV
ncbi:MAG: redox-regulated ATPase YchF [Wolbachia endosymbiont of Menacanthus eurysternus]|nr:MAG: redox-regulated ATPase YchF [Wolbachia endosymbiont of Menacanthus eurysternus]